MLMLSDNEIQSLLEVNQSLGETGELLKSSKYYYILLSDVSPGLYEDLHQLLPYAPHWSLEERVIATSKLVYAQMIKDMVSAKHGSAIIVHGTLVDVKRSIRK